MIGAYDTDTNAVRFPLEAGHDVAVNEWRVVWVEDSPVHVDGPNESLRVVYATSPENAARAVRRDRWPTELTIVGVVRID